MRPSSLRHASQDPQRHGLIKTMESKDETSAMIENKRVRRIDSEMPTLTFIPGHMDPRASFMVRGETGGDAMAVGLEFARGFT